MVSKTQFRNAAKMAVHNIVKHGDTDIFPFPFENHAFFDKRDNIIDLIVEYDEKFETYLARYSPRNVSSLTPVTYSGFRWATQIDPIWNAHFLSCVLALAQKIENARIQKKMNVIFSYRYKPEKDSGDLFDRKYGWVQFMEHSTKRFGMPVRQHASILFGGLILADLSDFRGRWMNRKHQRGVR
jgi:hypothetical protein